MLTFKESLKEHWGQCLNNRALLCTMAHHHTTRALHLPMTGSFW